MRSRPAEKAFRPDVSTSAVACGFASSCLTQAVTCLISARVSVLTGAAVSLSTATPSVPICTSRRLKPPPLLLLLLEEKRPQTSPIHKLLWQNVWGGYV